MSLTLFDYQRDGVTAIRSAYRSGAKGALYVLPTGGGKTVVSTYVAMAAQAKGTRVLFTAHREELVRQLSAALGDWGVEHGVIASWCQETRHPVQVAMVGTLARRLKLDRGAVRYGYDLVITDEAHHLAPGTQWAKVLEHNPGARYLGITATPCRLDGKPLGTTAGGFFDSLVEGPTILDLIERGRLARPVVYRAQTGPDLSGIRKRGGDFDQRALGEAMDQAALTGDAVAHYRRHCDRVPSIAFCVNLAHAAHVCDDFIRAGYSAAVISGKTPPKERAGMIRDLGAGALNVLVSVNTISEGTDVPVVGAAILLRPTASYSLSMQQIGRALRAYPGKERAVILDHAGNTHRHGLPTIPPEWSLTGKPKKPRGAGEDKECPGCYAVLPLATRVCPECGHEFNPERKEADGPETVAGDLVEVDAVAAARARRREQSKARTEGDLISLGRARGYKNPEGWARHILRHRGALA